MVLYPDYVNALGISDDDVQFQTTDHSGNLVFNLLTHETWIETESADNSPTGTDSSYGFAAFNSDDDAKLC